jgi:2-polyprenyl-3-methyl-5-hydroxy-6-metoxy-1,4-benzoquinol methylase
MILSCFPPDGNGRTVLDVGCGPEHLAGILADRGYRVTGIERTCPANGSFRGNAKLVIADLDAGLPDLGSRFDRVLCADVLEHLRDPLALLRQVRGVLAGGGLLIASLPNSGHAYFRWNIMLGRFPKHERGLFDATHLHFFGWQEWRELFASAGFEINRVLPTGVPVGLAFNAGDDNTLVRFLEWGSFQFARLWKTLGAYQFVVVAQVKE